MASKVIYKPSVVELIKTAPRPTGNLGVALKEAANR